MDTLYARDVETDKPFESFPKFNSLMQVSTLAIYLGAEPISAQIASVVKL